MTTQVHPDDTAIFSLLDKMDTQLRAMRDELVADPPDDDPAELPMGAAA